MPEAIYNLSSQGLPIYAGSNPPTNLNAFIADCPGNQIYEPLAGYRQKGYAHSLLGGRGEFIELGAGNRFQNITQNLGLES